MNRSAYFEKLAYDLRRLPEDERNELLLRCEAVFEAGLRQGMSEAEIVRRLSEPTAPNEYFEPGEPVPPPPWTSPPPWPSPPPAPAGRDWPRIFGVGALLFFLNVLLAIPIFAALWAVVVSVWATVAALVLSPLALLLEHFLYDDYAPNKMFLALGLVGVGMLLAGLARLFGKGLAFATKAYAGWNYKTWRGRT
ncbi:DUF1700 domain-containing protein [Paenibacillaceae bacterium WGS1546]|uniref:DUF1700 domain-containing protein n=1 Tax=Cohnella sp. WGS1546 TaxID=3366810 RepID=UPI00372D3C4E